MPKEIETKFKIHSPKEFRSKLKKIAAKFVSKNLEKDIYYKSPSTTCCRNTIRLRSMGKRGIFTIKSASRNSESLKYKIRNEVELAIDDVKTFRAMLQMLEFVPQFKKEKIRETYTWKDVKITLDKLPFIGFYAEIEGPKKTIRQAVRVLDFDMGKAIPDTYMQLFGYYNIIHKAHERELVFNKKK